MRRNGTSYTKHVRGTGSEVTKEIRFYRANEKPYGAFSNLYRRSIFFDNREFPTAEHAYQAGKALKEEVREWILSAPTPALVAMAAHGLYTWDIVPNWSRIKYERMRAVLRAKFSQHEDLCELLLGTGNVRLVEAGRVDNPGNRLWGEVNGKGANMLGVLLMELRAELRRERVERRKSAAIRTNIPGKLKERASIRRKRLVSVRNGGMARAD